MRSAIGILLGFAILIGGSTYVTNKIELTAQSINSQLEQAEELINSNNWDEAIEIINQAYEKWLPVKPYWALVLNHSTLSSIEISCLRLQQYALYKESAHTLAEIETLKILLNDIPESQSIRIYNIL